MTPILDNPELKQLRDEDQADRTYCSMGKLTESMLWKRDRKRLLKVIELIEANKAQTAVDCVHAAVVFQHGRNAQNERDPSASGMAVNMMKKAIALDPTTNKWLLAAAIDRDLMIRKKAQIYGTQYTRKSEDSQWEFYELDSTQISDEERKKFNVESLEEQKETLIRMNKKQLIEFYGHAETIKEVIEFCLKEEATTSAYDLSIQGIDTFGYFLLRAEKLEDALQVFQLGIKLYPEDFELQHSLGTCLVKMDKTKEALQAFEKSLTLKPDYELAQRDLDKLQKSKKP